MRKLLFSLLTIVLSLILISCDMYNDVKPRNQLNTKWVSDNPAIFFTVTEDEEGYYVCLGRLEDSEKSYNIELDFDFGRDVNIIDYDVLKKNNFISTMDDLLARGDCKFSKNKCIVTITESYIDSIKIDDKITFNKQQD